MEGATGHRDMIYSIQMNTILPKQMNIKRIMNTCLTKHHQHLKKINAKLKTSSDIKQTEGPRLLILFTNINNVVNRKLSDEMKTKGK